jgi:cell wall-associated NlpC family hydrolase
MKNSKTANFRVVITGVLTLPLALLFPSSALAAEDSAVTEKNAKASIETPALKKVQAIKGSLPFIAFSDSFVVVTAPSTASLTFDSPVITSSPNPEIAKAKELAEAIAEAEKKKVADEAEAKKKADEAKAEAEKLFAAGDVSSIEVKGFTPSGTEPLTAIDDKLVSIASTGLGKPYVWGGTTPAGWDCSGYVQWVYAQAGIKIPRVNQWEAGKLTTTPVPGDIVVQNNNTHVGIYAGGGMMYSALNPDQDTRFHSVNIAPSYFIHIER